MKLAKKRVPKGFVEVDAKEFYEHPELYSDEGFWVSVVDSR